MRRYLIALAAFAISASIPGLARAVPEAYPVCLAGGSADALRCDYTNLEQCRATASGGLGYCVSNPAYTSNPYAGYRHAGKRVLDGRTW